MGTMWGFGRAARTAGGEVGPLLHIEAPQQPYRLSPPLTTPKQWMDENGTIWEQYEAQVVDPVTVWQEIQGPRASGGLGI